MPRAGEVDVRHITAMGAVGGYAGGAQVQRGKSKRLTPTEFRSETGQSVALSYHTRSGGGTVPQRSRFSIWAIDRWLKELTM